METITKIVEEDGILKEVVYEKVSETELTKENQLTNHLLEALKPFNVDETTIEDIIFYMKENKLLAE